ncbi:MAG TPA: gas vesicle protein GvpG [Longimicrobiales bacterium]
MGILKHLLFWPVTGPLFLARFSLEKVEGVVREQLTDDAAVKAELLELQLQLELGEVDDANYAQREAALMRRLREVREWRERLGMDVAGGLVRVAASEEVTPEGPSVDLPGAGEAPAPEESAPQQDKSPRVADPRGASVEIKFDWE